MQWYRDYVATYVERDVRQLLRVADLDAFQQFVRLCAHWTGQLLNLTRMATDCGVSATTAKAWLGVLRASYIVHLLQPHHVNFRKRLVKSPKLYFLDSGMAAHLLSVQHPEDLRTHPMRGPLFESWTVSELLKGRFNRGLGDNLYCWRSQGGDEIDVLADHGRTLLPIECKSGRTIAADWFEGIEKWSQWAGKKGEAPQLVYGGDRSAMQRGVRVVPWRDIASLTSAV
jgi:predicted AAA+ superfamily ATPase